MQVRLFRAHRPVMRDKQNEDEKDGSETHEHKYLDVGFEFMCTFFSLHSSLCDVVISSPETGHTTGGSDWGRSNTQSSESHGGPGPGAIFYKGTSAKAPAAARLAACALAVARALPCGRGTCCATEKKVYRKRKEKKAEGRRKRTSILTCKQNWNCHNTH